jgi:hypothetical protein
MKDNNDIGQSVTILVLGTFLGVILGSLVTNKSNESSAISVGVGYHNPISGRFEWRTNLEPVRLTK